MKFRQIAIVGGGPSGSLCGERLARAGFDVTLYDEHLAWEKPCGGGLTHKAVLAYPFLLESPLPKKLIHTVQLIASNGCRALLELDHPIVIYSRTILNGLLLSRAESAGCRIVRSRVTKIEAREQGACLQASAGSQEADFVVIASGARNALLPGTRPLGRTEMEMTLGYFVPAQSDLIQVKFLPQFEGYIWSFPRSDHLSVGICGSMSRHTSQQLRQALDQFLLEQHICIDGAQFYSHVLPAPRTSTFRNRRVVGPNWALVGDAAALVDPITGEGLYYALRSGELLADALAAGQPEGYPARVRAGFSADLEFATRVARRVYSGRFLGGAVTTRMIQFIRRSATFRMLMADLFSGAQSYAGLKRRLWSQLGFTTSEIIASLLRPGTSLAQPTAEDL